MTTQTLHIFLVRETREEKLECIYADSAAEARAALRTERPKASLRYFGDIKIAKRPVEPNLEACGAFQLAAALKFVGKEYDALLTEDEKFALISSACKIEASFLDQIYDE